MKGKKVSCLATLVSVILIMSMLLLFGCATAKPATATSPAASQAPVTATAAAAPSTTAANNTALPASTGAEKTLKVGLVAWFGWSLGLDQVHDIQVQVEMDNANGGIEIGGQKYKIDLIVYDTNNSQSTEVAAINRLIFQDNVKYILGDGRNMSSWLQVADDNKVVSLVGLTDPSNLDPKYKYTCNPWGTTTFPITVAWFTQKYPELVKNWVLALSDDFGGHMMEKVIGGPAEVMGAKMNYIYYPAHQTDLSSLGTKVASLNPGVFSASGLGVVEDGLAMASAWQAGYRGQYFCPDASPYGSLTKVMPAEALEGFIGGAEGVEFDPPLNAEGVAFKAAYTAKYGKWDDPATLTCYYSCLRGALEKAGTIDTDKVNAVIQGGLRFSTPTGEFQMIPRPEMGNTRTVDSVCEYSYKIVKNGHIELLETLTLDRALEFWSQLGAKMAAGMVPPTN